MLHKLCPAIAGRSRRHQKAAAPPPVKANATVVLVKKNVMGFNDFNASLLDNVGEFLGNRVCFHLVSATSGESVNLRPRQATDGHGDKNDEPWWPKLETVAELTKTCTTIIWVASALHAAVNFGQFPYAGYLPNRPTITSQLQTILGVSPIEVLSRHSSDEV